MRQPDFRRQLAGLLDNPREDLEVEIKSWLDFSDRNVAAAFARELIALANHGGGYVLLGFSERADGWRWTTSCPFPEAHTSQDAINNLCKRYAEPSFHCRVHRLRSTAGNDHVVIEVPGGHRVPIRARRGSPDRQGLDSNVYYIRRPGPESAPVGTPQEWDTLLRRCLSNQREELLNSFRAIADAIGPRSTDALDLLNAESALSRWRRDSRARLDQLMSERSPGEESNPYERGTYSAAYRLVGLDREVSSLHELEDILMRCKGHETGWPVWIMLTRPDLRPYPYRNTVECWHADGGTAHADYWRVSREGRAFLLRGFQEDDSERVPPGTALDLTLPIWRTAECLLHASRLGSALGARELEFSMQWEGLAGRSLETVANQRRFVRGEYKSRQDEVSTSVVHEVAAVEDALPELVRRLVEPLYEAFDFFQPAGSIYTDEIAEMRDRR